MQDTFATLFEFHRWAEERVLTECSLLTTEQYTRHVGGSYPTLRALIAHLAASGHAWRLRLDGEIVTALMTDQQVPDVETAMRYLLQAYETFNREAAKPAEALNEIFTYRNLRGVDISIPRWALLRHIVNHGTYHRGQMVAMLRLLGATPPSTDFVAWAGQKVKAEASTTG